MIIEIPVMAILKIMIIYAVLPLIVNIALLYLAVVTGASRHVLQGTYDELLWLVLLPMSWLGTLIITLLILTGAYDGIKYNYFGGFEEDRRREAEIFERIRIQEIKRKEAEAKYEEEMRPHRERFNKELLKVAAYLSKEK